MSVLANTEPKEVFRFFEEISQIPRGSYNTKAVSDYCVAFARERDLEVVQDTWNNVIIKKPGTAGYEESEPVILQGHLDMVCEKTVDSTHDFMKDPLEIYMEDGFVHAKDTTLGADNGIAIAMTLAVLDSDTIEHPPIEAIFTVDEEVDMSGAENVDMSLIKGKMLLNLDSEEEGILTAGCAGGFGFGMKLPIVHETVEGTKMTLEIAGLKGGHSGIDIDLQRGNANKLAGRLLYRLSKETKFSLVTIDGGSKENVITFSNKMVIVAADPAKVECVASEMLDTWKNEFTHDEPGITIKVTVADEGSYQAMSKDTLLKLMAFLRNCPNGVDEFSRSLENMVEASDNLGVVVTNEDHIWFKFLVRSGIASKLEDIKERLCSFAELLDVEYTITGQYPGWAFKEESRIREITSDAYEAVTGKRPEVMIIHAGLECGILSSKKEDLDCISLGPEMFDVHSFNERLSIKSTENTWNVIKEILRRCK